jgi:pimeloyl-ACP methyl ester carboxylesterase
MGETLSWPYYAFVRANPITRWDNPTWILYGANDNLTPGKLVDAFVTKFDCRLDVLENGEHYFHTKEQMEVVDRWLNQNI